MAVRAGKIYLNTAANLNIPPEKIYELGNWNTIAVVGTSDIEFVRPKVFAETVPFEKPLWTERDWVRLNARYQLSWTLAQQLLNVLNESTLCGQTTPHQQEPR